MKNTGLGTRFMRKSSNAFMVICSLGKESARILSLFCLNHFFAYAGTKKRRFPARYPFLTQTPHVSNILCSGYWPLSQKEDPPSFWVNKKINLARCTKATDVTRLIILFLFTKVNAISRGSSNFFTNAALLSKEASGPYRPSSFSTAASSTHRQNSFIAVSSSATGG